ncbi:MAG: YncE family protein [Verrucomicrobiota bacterium]|nr:YncE family protein [Verrucomicrobiota bacterium]
MRILPLLIGLCAVTSALSAPAPKFQKLQEIPIPGDGGWDILTVDAPARRLYVSHATEVVVVDMDANRVVGEIADTPGVHTFFPLPGGERGFSSNGKENTASVVDLKTLKTISKVETGPGPDAIAYDGSRGEVYVFNHKGNSVTMIDAKSAKAVATVALGGSPEFGVADEKGGRVYCNLEDKSEVVAIDTATHEVVARWPLGPGEGPSGIALDAVHHRLFSTCDNELMMMLNTESGKVVASVPIGDHVDGCAFDEAGQLVFASCGDGTTTVAHEDGPERLSVVQVVETERSARTMALDPKTQRIYLASAQFESPPIAAPGATPSRPKMVPNTMKLLVYGPAAAKTN